MKFSVVKCYFLLLFTIQILLIFWFVIVWQGETQPPIQRPNNLKNNFPIQRLNIEIWSKAAVGDYLWTHVLEGSIQQNVGNGYYLQGDRSFDDMDIRFRSGYSLVPTAFEQFVRQKTNESDATPVNTLLVLNGRSNENIQKSMIWLNHIKSLIASDDFIRDRLNLILLMLGHEYCFNAWIKPYLKSNGGFVKALLIVYDWKEVDDQEVFQWPLGVATYRGFPLHPLSAKSLKHARPYVCNFVGTVYPNTSRAELDRLYQTIRTDTKCLFKSRYEWQPTESSDSLQSYIEALQTSDLTLNPIGMNHECYRIYEALSFGSHLIVEQNLHHVAGKRSQCDSKQTLRLLKQFKAPITYVTNWTDQLPSILQNELKLTDHEKMQRRIESSSWYSSFKQEMRFRLFNVLKSKFHHVQR